MKLRIRGNSLRLRLTQSEVAQLKEAGKVEEKVEFGGSPSFVYALETTKAENVMASFENNRLTIFIPRGQAEGWINSGQVSIEAEQANGDEKSLRILIEKDFACLESRPHDDDSDAFPHPEPEKIC